MSKADRYPSQVFWDERDKGYVAIAPDLPGCSAFGATKAKALKELDKAIEAWLASVDPHTEVIPEPSPMPRPSSCSGKILVRVPVSLHARLVADARAEGVSLNHWIVSILSSGPRFNVTGEPQIMAVVSPPVRTGQFLKFVDVSTASGSDRYRADTTGSPWASIEQMSALVVAEGSQNG